MPALIDIQNQRFGSWLVIDRVPVTGNRRGWLCMCDCGAKKIVRRSHLMESASTKCRQCSTKRGSQHANWKGYGGLSATKWKHILNHAYDRNLEVSITIEDAWMMFIDQDQSCNLTGLNLNIQDASLDRIDSSKGYRLDNIQWLHKNIQQMKWNFPEERFVELCRLVVSHHEIQ